MLYKLLYPRHLDTTDVKIDVTDGMNVDGTPKVILTYAGKCRFNESHKLIRDVDGKLIMLEGRIYIGEDIAPNINVIEGNVEINGVKYQIYKASRPRNPDGSVNHTKLELI